MNIVSLNKIRPSALLKVPGLCILGLLAVAFLLFPLAAFAGCSAAPAPKATLNISHVEPLFGPNCGGAAAKTNATISGTNPTTLTTTTTTTSPTNPVNISLLTGIAKCQFAQVKLGEKVALHNGDIVLGQISKADNSGKAGSAGDVILGMVINGQFRAINGDGKGGHAAGILNGKAINFTLDNGAVQGSNGKVDSTPND